MDKIDSFKNFVKTKPYLAYKVHSGLTSWQKLYEIYDVYGENHEIFSSGEKAKEEPPKVETKNEPPVTEKVSPNQTAKIGIASILKTIQDIDVDKFSENLNSVKKIFTLFERPKSTTVENPPKTYKRFED
jgi:hypothetical protein